MSKKCINCNNPKIYSDTYIKCEKCNNFLRKINDSDDPLPKEEIKIHNENAEDPYSGYYNAKDDLNKTNKKEDDTEDNNWKKDKKRWSLPKFNLNFKKDSGPIAEGIIKNFSEKEVKTFMITKVYRCITEWVNYTPSNFSNFFQVYSGWGVNDGESETGQDVVFYGKISKGNIANNNEVVVYGKKLKNGTVVGRKIYNKTTGTYIKANYAIHPIIILAVLLYIMKLIYNLVAYDWDEFFIKVKAFIIFMIFVIFIIYIAVIKPFSTIFKK